MTRDRFDPPPMPGITHPKMTIRLKNNPVPVTRDGVRVGWATVNEDGTALIQYDDGTTMTSRFFTQHVRVIDVSHEG